MSKIKDIKLRYKIAAGVATSAAIVGLGGAAFAYWTGTGSTGSGTGAVASNGAVTIDNVGFSGSLTPGSSVTVSYKLNNATGTDLKVGQVTADTSNGNTDGISGLPTGCLASDFTYTPSSTTSYLVPANTDTVSDSGTLAMADTALNQDNCKNAHPVLHLVAGTLASGS